MSSDEQDDDLTIVIPHHGEYAASEPGTSPHRVKTGKTRLSEAEILCCDAIAHYNVDPMVYVTYENIQDQKLNKKTLVLFQIHAIHQSQPCLSVMVNFKVYDLA